MGRPIFPRRAHDPPRSIPATNSSRAISARARPTRRRCSTCSVTPRSTPSPTASSPPASAAPRSSRPAMASGEAEALAPAARHRRQEQGAALVHRPGLLRHAHAAASILRNMLENPGWYTAYTPYQPEISQGRLEALLNFQTMVARPHRPGDRQRLAARRRHRRRRGDDVLQAPVEEQAAQRVLRRRRTAIRRRSTSCARAPSRWASRSSSATSSRSTTCRRSSACCCSTRRPNGDVHDLQGHRRQAPRRQRARRGRRRPAGAHAAHAAGRVRRRRRVGSAQRFGVPLGFGGPHAAYFATKDAFKRDMPGRLVGVSIDRHGKPALSPRAADARAAHPPREGDEQHLHRAGAARGHREHVRGLPRAGRAAGDRRARARARPRSSPPACSSSASQVEHDDVLRHDHASRTGGRSRRRCTTGARGAAINLREIDADAPRHLARRDHHARRRRSVVARVRRRRRGRSATSTHCTTPTPRCPSGAAPHVGVPAAPGLQHATTPRPRCCATCAASADNDLALDRTMIPLGSCTMKLNATSEMIPVTWPEFGAHASVRAGRPGAGLRADDRSELERMLCEITGYDAVSLQPNAGSQGEYAGLLVIRAYHASRGEGHRDVCLIPSSAHGTNPASAEMAGMRVVVVACDAHGNVDLDDLRAKAAQHADELAALMITYPSTHGVFEEGVREICEIVHRARRPGVHRRREHERAGRPVRAGRVRRRRLPPEPAQDLLHPARRRRPGRGADRREAHLAPFLPGHPHRRIWQRKRSAPVCRRAVRQREHPADLVDVHPHDGRRRPDRGHAGRDPQRELHRARLEPHYPVLYTGHERPRRARVHPRPAPAQGQQRHQRRGRRQAPDRLRLPRADDVVPGRRHADDRADRERVEGRARPLLRRDDRDPRRDPRGRERHARQGRQPAAATRRTPRRKWSRRVDASVLARSRRRTRCRRWCAGKYWPPVARVDNVYGDRNLVCSCPPIEAYAE